MNKLSLVALCIGLLAALPQCGRWRRGYDDCCRTSCERTCDAPCYDSCERPCDTSCNVCDTCGGYREGKRPMRRMKHDVVVERPEATEMRY